MGPLRRIKLTKLNEHLVCKLCNGYFVEATTISECLHTFCKTCIVRYLKNSSFCPVCEALVHKTRPISGLREDRTLQDVVFKLVPNLFRNEMSRRVTFYKEHPEAGGDRTEQSLKERRHFFHVDDQISLSLEYLPPAHAHAHALGLRPLRAPSFSYSQPPSIRPRASDGAGADAGPSAHGGPESEDGRDAIDSEGEEEEKIRIPLRRYLKCPAAVQIRLLEKFIRLKYNLNSHHKVDIVHSGDCLSPELTLLDVVYMYKWTEDDPLKLQYTVIAPPLPPRKRPRPSSAKAQHHKPSSLEPSPKKLKSEKSSSFSSPTKERSSEEESKVPSPRKTKREKDKSPFKKMSSDEGRKDMDTQSSLENSKSPKSSPTKFEKREEGKESMSSTDGCSSLNSSRDDADDAMVIDESPPASTETTDTSSHETAPMETDATSHLKDQRNTNALTTQTKTSQTSTITTATTTTTTTTVVPPSTPAIRQQPNIASVSEGIPLSVKSNYGSGSTLISKSALSTPGAPNSSIESLKALVNNSSYSGFPSKQGVQQLPGKGTSNNTSSVMVSQTLNKNSASAITTLGAKATQSHFVTSKNLENSLTSPNRPHTPNISRPSTPGTPARPGVTGNSPLRSSTPGAPNRPNTPAVSSGLPAKATNPKIPASGVVSTKVSSTSDASPLSTNSLLQMPPTSLAAAKASLAKASSSATITNVSTTKVSISKSFISSPNYSQGHPTSMPPNSKPIPGSLPKTSLPAPTSLTPALKTPLPSATPRLPHTSQGINGSPSVNSLNLARNPGLAPAQRLVSNSYRATLQMNGNLRVNGMIGGAPRPVIDPTKPRLGRPPNSVRVAAGRMMPQPIVPRGSNPRDIYTAKGTKSEGGRGRPKGHGSSGAGRGSINRLIAPHPSVMPIGPGISLRPNSSAQQLQNTQGAMGTTNKEAEMVNGLKGNNASGTHLLNGVTGGKTIKGTLQNNTSGNNLSQGTKPVGSAAVNGTVNKEQKKTSSEPSASVASTKGNLNTLQTNSASVTAPTQQIVTQSPGQQTNRLSTGTSSGGLKGGTKSPGRSKSLSGTGSNTSSILSIAQTLANKKLQQISQGATDVGMSSLAGGVTTPSTISPVTVAAAAAAAASLSPQLSAATLGLNPALCAAYMSDYAAVQSLFNLSSLSAAARINLAMTQVPTTPVIDSGGDKGDSGPMDLSPTNKGAPNTALSASTRQVKGNVKSGNSSSSSGSNKKSPSSSTPTEGFKSPPILSPKGGPPPPSTPPSVPSPKPAQSPSPDSASTPHGISPPTPEVTITKLPTQGIENPSTPSSSASSAPKAAHTNTVSITKRPSVPAAVSSGTTSKYLVTRSPSNASVRQIPNPSHLSHSQSSVATSKANPKGSKQGLHHATLANNNNNNNNNNSNSANKAVKVDL